MARTDPRTEVVSLRKQVADLKEAAAVRRRQENAIRDALELTRGTLEECPVPLGRLDPAGRLILGNTALARLLGYHSRHELMELVPVLGLFLDPDRLRALLSIPADPDGFAELTGEFRSKEGKPRLALLRVKRVTAPEGLLFGVIEAGPAAG